MWKDQRDQSVYSKLGQQEVLMLGTPSTDPNRRDHMTYDTPSHDTVNRDPNRRDQVGKHDHMTCVTQSHDPSRPLCRLEETVTPTVTKWR